MDETDGWIFIIHQRKDWWIEKMGYYNQDYEQNMRNQKGNRFAWLYAAIVGAILGGLLVIFTFPALLKLDVLPYDLATGHEEEQQQNGVNGDIGANDQVQNIVNVSVVSEVTQAVEKATDAVVGVINIQQTGFWSETGEAGTGSGVVYKKANGNAYVVTNHHVIEGASEIEVSLPDGTRVPAEVLGSDIFTDLAVLRIDADHVSTVAELGTSEHLRPGEPVIAIGNPLGLRFSGSVTQGIISGLNRTIEIDLTGDGRPDWQAEVIQTDAAINPGNSGGALVNIKGQVIGINSMKIAQQAVEGIGLAIPIDIAKPIIDDLEKNGEVERPYMGVGLRSLNEISSYHWTQTLRLPQEVKAGVFIVSVVPLSPADQAGLIEKDVIVALDGEPIRDVIDLRKHLYTKKEIGDTMTVTFYRNGKKQTTKMTLAKDEKYE